MTRERLAIETEQLKVTHCCHKSKVMRIVGIELLQPEYQQEWREFMAKVYPSWQIEWV